MVDCDRVTIAQAAKGDKKAFRRLYDHYAPFIWRIVFRSAGNDHDAAEEIVQETFIRIHRSLKSFNASSSLGTWIYRIAFNASQSFLSKRARLRAPMVPFIDDRPDPHGLAEAYETRDLVNTVLNGLTAEDRFLLVAREVDGLTFEEIAEICGKTSESLRTRMSRMKEKIRSIGACKPLLAEAAV
jgi:RNA polymerase sigma-70 factor, ECF subfamily